MNRYEKRIENLANHVKQNPRDYQSAISLAILNSKQIDYKRKQKQKMAFINIQAYKKGGYANGE
mgnify:CR=1 FL=1